MYKNIIFDLDETLVDSSKATDLLFENIVLNNLPYIPSDTFRKIFREILVDEMKHFENKKFMKYGIGTYDLFLHPNIERYLDETKVEKIKKQVIENTLQQLDVTPTDFMTDSIIKEFKQDWFIYYDVIPETHKVLEELYNSNFNLYMLTNGFKDIQYAKIKKCGLLKWFDKIVISEELGVGKPNIEVFLKLVTEENLEISETIMIGDSLSNDYLPAKEIGIDSILFDRFNNCSDTNITKIESIAEMNKFITIDPLHK